MRSPSGKSWAQEAWDFAMMVIGMAIGLSIAKCMGWLP